MCTLSASYLMTQSNLERILLIWISMKQNKIMTCMTHRIASSNTTENAGSGC